MVIKSFGKELNVSINVCNHRFGAKATFSFQTDSRFVDSIYQAEYYACKNNVRIGAFITNLLGQDNSNIKAAEDTGIIKHDIYHCTDLWMNPQTNIVERIPDYYEDKWSSNGASYFNVEIGTTKNTRFPSHGQNLYDLSNGKYGYDLVNGQEGKSKQSELLEIVQLQQNWFKNILGKNSSTGSYRVGDNRAWNMYLPHWIAIRNSHPSPTKPTVSNADTYYGVDQLTGTDLGFRGNKTLSFREYWINYPSSFRWWDCWNTSGYTKEEATTFYKRELKKAIDSGGWYRDFCHFHSAKSYGNIESIEEFMQIFNEVRGSDFVWTCSNGEAVEYLFLRELTKRVFVVENGDSLILFTDVIDKFKTEFINSVSNKTLTESINIGLSVEIDLSNTILSGKDIVTSFGKTIKKGTDIYIVEIPFNGIEMFQPLEIKTITKGVYTTFEKLLYDIENDILRTEEPVHIIVFDTTKDYEPIYRSQELSTIHKIDMFKDLKCKICIVDTVGNSLEVIY